MTYLSYLVLKNLDNKPASRGRGRLEGLSLGP